MIANPTTLILGAGASHPVYPVGSALRSDIIKGFGAGEYDKYLAVGSSNSDTVDREKERYYELKERFNRSHIVSIDAFLAEPENKKLAEVGHIAIAAALLPRESKEQYPDWYPDLFNAIRVRDIEVRQNKLTVVTFNYDLSLEFFLVHAFRNAYGLSAEDARKLFDANVEIIHVYGELGELSDLSDPNRGREYGAESVNVATIAKAAKGIKIIERHQEGKGRFLKAFQAIKDARFVAILGYGFDAMNNANLQLELAVADKCPFSTGYGLGCGARARLTTLATKSGMIMGGKTETVRTFLDETDFLRWINEPNASSNEVGNKIGKVFEQGMLPYVR